MTQVDPRDMLNNFCFHVYAQKSLFIGENGTARAITVHRAGSQLKIVKNANSSLKRLRLRLHVA